MKDGVSAISALDAAKLPNKTTSIPGRPNEFVVELDVFHQLHCLNTLRKTFYPDRYSSEFQDYFLTSDGRRNYTSTAARHYGKPTRTNVSHKCHRKNQIDKSRSLHRLNPAIHHVPRRYRDRILAMEGQETDPASKPGYHAHMPQLRSHQGVGEGTYDCE